MVKKEVLDKVNKFFPNAQITYKNQSLLFKILTLLFFFIPSIKSPSTTIGYTVYYQSEAYTKLHPVSSFIILLHEITHMYDEKKIGKVLYTILYLMPQLLFLFAIPLFFIIGFKALLLLLFILPVPAYFRMMYEKRAYISSLYVINKLNDKCDYHINIDEHCKIFIDQFKGSQYYFVWPFQSIDKEFELALSLIKNNKRPFNDKIFDILDEIIAVF